MPCPPPSTAHDLAPQESLKKRQEQAEEDERKRKIAAAEASRVQRFKHEDPVSGSPMKSAQVSASAPSSSQSAGGAGKFEARTNKGKVSQTHNEALPKALASPTQITVEELSVVRYKRCMNNTFDAMSGCAYHPPRGSMAPDARRRSGRPPEASGRGSAGRQQARA